VTLNDKQLEALSNFFIDSAKIIFGSLVIGVFTPIKDTQFSWLTLACGLFITVLFLFISINLLTKDKHE
jgi:hypothetical protein